MVLFLRHFESFKNVYKQFSSDKDDQNLTEFGRNQVIEASQAISQFVNQNSLVVTKVCCANSIRAKLTASFIAEKLSVPCFPFDELRSNNSGALRGKSEIEARSIHPIFMKQLDLFRSGLYSSYDFEKMFGREDKHDFEKRVNKCIQEQIANDKGNLHIFVLHHSSITAAMIDVARRLYGYPDSFYGHVVCELGNCFLVNNKDILLCNEKTTKLMEINV